MTVSSSEFISGMRQFSAAVNIITTGSGEQRAGFTATAVFSLTAEPPQIGIAVNRSISSFAALRRNAHFCVNTLSNQQEQIARRFAGGVNREARFACAEWSTLATGAPALVGAVVNFDCVEVDRIDFSTHDLVVGRVVAIRVGESRHPLLYVNGQWASPVPTSANAFGRGS